MVQKPFFFNFDPNSFFECRKVFPQKLFQECKKSQHWRLYGVYWPAKLFFESRFSKKFWFSNNTFSIENWCVVNILTQFLTLCGNQFKLWQEVLYFSSKAWGVAKKLLIFLIKIWRVVKRCFKILYAVRIPIPEITRCKNLFQNLILFQIIHSKLAFYPVFLRIMVSEKTDNCRSWGFAW